MTAVIAVNHEVGFRCYGGAAKFWQYTGPEVVLSEPYDTGKTITALQKLNVLLAKYANARALMVRKTYKSLINSAVVTFEEKVHRGKIDAPGYPISKYGGERPEHYDYPNGARLVLGGMDNPQKTLSAEYDFVYVPQLEELTADEYQALVRACSGRAGNAPYTQLLCDCNPDVPEHWILKRGRLVFLESRHEDNPTIYERDANGNLTGNYALGGEARMAALDSMTGVRYKRGRLGLWVGREGQVYEYDPAIHLIDRFDIPEDWPRYRCIDFGYANPFVCKWYAVDGDGRLYRYREIYMSQRTVKQHAKLINSFKEPIVATVADHDAEDRATLAENGIHTIAADKRISVGIEKMEERIKAAKDGKPRIFYLRDSLIEVDQRMRDQSKPTCTEEEFGGYVWPTTKAGRAADERPIKTDDHGMDTDRYMIMYFDGGENFQVGW